MMRLHLPLLLLLVQLCSSGVLWAQEDAAKDTVVQVYVKLEKVSRGTWFTRTLYDLFFKPIAFGGEKEGYRYRRLAHQPYADYEGLPVAGISIVTLDPFGFDVYDTTEVPSLGTERFGNALHVKTLRSTVNNLLLFRTGEPFDSLLVKESERLIRQELYIQEVFFYPQLVDGNSDSVHVLIRVLDSWSLLPELGISPTRFSVGFTENNVLGLNHVFHNFYTWNHALDRHAFRTDYTVRNIRNTYVNARASYLLNELGDHRAGIELDRPFYSTVTRWAGGLSAFFRIGTDTVYATDSITQFLSSTSVSQDYWAARAWQLTGGTSEAARATNLIVGARVSALTFMDRPGGDNALLDIYRDRAMVLGGVGLSTRRYLRDRYIFNYGFIEDVPIGRSYGMVAGYEVSVDPRWYVGAHYSWGHYYKWGYFSTRLDYGNYFRNGRYEQGTVRGGISYFTGLLELGKWKFRQFVKPEFTIGLSRIATDNITLNEGRGGLRGFNTAEISGTHRMMLTLQSQSYAPWKLLGFQFGPYFVFSMGALGNERDGFSKSTVYTQFGLGVLVNNRYLVFENFELSISYFPLIPGTGENNGEHIFLGNTFRTTDFGFPDYGLGRPDVVGY